MKKVILLIIAGIGLVSCTNDETFTIPETVATETQNEVYLNQKDGDTTGGQGGVIPIKP
ncbi:hypothetical protein [Flavobacterium sp. U410]|jgi:hypothetical protein